MSNWFEIDKEGLSKILARKGKASLICEPVQNAWDQNVSRVDISLTAIAGRPQAQLIVEDDDPEGFLDLAHAYTLLSLIHI